MILSNATVVTDMFSYLGKAIIENMPMSIIIIALIIAFIVWVLKTM